MKHLDLGASLYVPATRPDLAAIGNGDRLPGVRSVIFCTEDAIRADEVEDAIDSIDRALGDLRPSPRLRFIRVRNPTVLRRLLTIRHIGAIDGFVLPKATPENLPAYLDPLEDWPAHCVMPTIETAEAFDRTALEQIRHLLEGVQSRVLAVRIGGNDLLQLIGVRRSPRRTIYDTAIGQVIAGIVTVFKPAGFHLTAPVFEGLNHPGVLREEVERDLDHGLFGKTAVHPDQVPIIEAQYAVQPEDLEMAERALHVDAPAVFRMHDTMVEPATHRVWAVTTLARARIYGVRTTAAVTGATTIPDRGNGTSAGLASPSASSAAQ